MYKFENSIKQALEDMGNDREIFTEVTETFIIETPEKFSNMRLLLKQGNSKMLIEDAHTIKSSARICGLYQIGDIAEKIEEEGITENTENLIEKAEEILTSAIKYLKEKNLINPAL